MNRSCCFAILYFLWLGLSAQENVYFPDQGYQWKEKQPEAVNVDSELLNEAISFAQNHESKNPKDLEKNHYKSFGREPFGDAVGPHKSRGPQTGMIIKNGFIIAKWGEPRRVDMTFSVTKSFLSTTVGLAYDQGLIENIHDQVADYIGPVFLPYVHQSPLNKADFLGKEKVIEPFQSEHNRKITWDHLLRQTSDWQGSLWGKPDWADRPSDNPSEWMDRPLNEPGSVFEYNDTRVNLLALCIMQLHRESLPEVLRKEIMDPIGATRSWAWLGYDNSWVNIDGKMMQAVSGGGHWGGGMFINAYDQARFGYLTLRRGKWKDKEILSDEWISMALTPGPANDGYGFMNWFLNTGRNRLPSAPENAFVHLGAGTNMIYVDPDHDLVVVARWIENSQMDAFIQKVLSALK